MRRPGPLPLSTQAAVDTNVMADPPPSRPLKRSFSIAGHKTSISLEAAFWQAFRELCDADGVTMAAQIAILDRQRGDAAGLSGTVRVWILHRCRAELRALRDQAAGNEALDAHPATR